MKVFLSAKDALNASELENKELRAQVAELTRQRDAFMEICECKKTAGFCFFLGKPNIVCTPDYCPILKEDDA